MLGSILDLAEREVREVMVHRREMETISIHDPVKDIVEKVLGGKHTRLPVWMHTPDNIIGILHSKILVRALRDYQGPIETFDIPSVLKEPWFVPENTSLKDQLRAFRREHTHFALVVDEYGVLLGVVTLEDILEEIVGQIQDELDIGAPSIRKHPDGSCTVDGTASVRDLNRELNWTLPDDLAPTVAGLVIHETQTIPEVGQVFRLHGYRFRIIRKQRHQITALRVAHLEEDEGQ